MESLKIGIFRKIIGYPWNIKLKTLEVDRWMLSTAPVALMSRFGEEDKYPSYPPADRGQETMEMHFAHCRST